MEAFVKDASRTRAPSFDESKKRNLYYIHQYSSNLVAMVLSNCTCNTEVETIAGGAGSEPRVNVYIHRTKDETRLGVFIVWPVCMSALSQNFWDRLYKELCKDVETVEKEIEREQRCKN